MNAKRDSAAKAEAELDLAGTGKRTGASEPAAVAVPAAPGKSRSRSRKQHVARSDQGNGHAVAVVEQRAPAAPLSESAQVLVTINQMARDPAVNVDKMQALLAMHRELLADQRRIEFFDRLATIAGHLPAIRKDGRLIIEKGGQRIQNTPYATWENIHRAVTPILAGDGFALMHQTENAPDGLLRIKSTLARNGHSESTFYDLPIDASGSKNNVQGRGSSTSYGKRYNTINLLNIRTEGEDNDGKSAPETVMLITNEQATELISIITDVVGDDAGRRKERAHALAQQFDVDDIRKISANDFENARVKVKAWAQKQKSGDKANG